MMGRETKMVGRSIALFASLAAAFALTACGGKSPPAAVSTAAPNEATAPAATEVAAAPAPASNEAATAPSAVALAPTDATWSPEALEELLAPVALYPDVVLGQVLVSATNPQEVLDAGNWILQNQNLKEKALDQAAKTAGFTAPVRGLLQSPEVIDMMCSELNWTTELGQAFVNDQAGVLDAVQRLRAQAKATGNLKTSPQLKVDTEVKENKEVITVSPPSPTVVYVPQYDPAAVYAPAPAAAPAPVSAPTSTGHSTGALVATGVMAFTAGILVHNVFDDDDDYYHGGYYPSYYGPPRPYYPPAPYRPRYGNGYYPSDNYRRPTNYQHGFNNNTVNINSNNSNNYFSRYDNKSVNNRSSHTVNSPITAANPKRTDLPALNSQAKQGPQRPTPSARDTSKIQGTYAGATRDSNGGAASSARGLPQPKVQGSYAGAGAQSKAADAKGRSVATPAPKATPASKVAAATAAPKAASPARPAASADRGRDTGGVRSPSPAPAAGSARDASAVSGVDRGAADRAASQRGHQSLPKGAPSAAAAGNRRKK